MTYEACLVPRAKVYGVNPLESHWYILRINSNMALLSLIYILFRGMVEIVSIITLIYKDMITANCKSHRKNFGKN